MKQASAAASTLWLLGAILAASYLAARWVEAPGLIGPVWKASGIVLLAAAAARSGAGLAALALALSAVGDFLLELQPTPWISGMSAFAVAHLFFIAAFARRIRAGGLKRGRLAAVGAVLVGSAGLLVWFLPDMGALTAPGLAYHGVLTAMATAALFAPMSILAPVGAIAFLISDALIALGLYKGLGPYPFAVWTIYASAQVMLARAFISGASK